jgi:hypothetical protein
MRKTLDDPLNVETSMSAYEVLGQREWKRRRTVADAIEVLHKDAGFEGDDRAEIRLGPMRLPSGDIVNLVGIFFESAVHQKTFIVWLPTAVKFRAILHDHSVIDQFDIGRLEEAVWDDAGNVELRDGTLMRAVDIIPAPLPYKLSGLDCAIIRLAISKLGAQHKNVTDAVGWILSTTYHPIEECTSRSGSDFSVRRPIRHRATFDVRPLSRIRQPWTDRVLAGGSTAYWNPIAQIEHSTGNIRWPEFDPF